MNQVKIFITTTLSLSILTLSAPAFSQESFTNVTIDLRRFALVCFYESDPEKHEHYVSNLELQQNADGASISYSISHEPYDASEATAPDSYPKSYDLSPQQFDNLMGVLVSTQPLPQAVGTVL